ncbi:MAG: sigma-54-dependent transcriptional regulator [Bacillota bacterium]
MMSHVLVVDDEKKIQTLLKKILLNQGCFVTTAGDARTATMKLAQREFKAALIDLFLPDASGLELLKTIQKNQPACRCIIMTGYSTVKTALKAIQLGAFDYLEKPFGSIENVRKAIQNAIDFEQLSRESTEFKRIQHFAGQVDMVISENEEMKRQILTAFKIADKNLNVLITGETGTGKDVMARFIHAASKRNKNIFIPVNCGAFQESLLESELFGHEKGAFTGSIATRKGIFELADQGTLFLDELAEANPAIQVKLLRVLETGQFVRVGGEKPILTDVRIIAASNANVEKLVRNRKLREDLYYRLNVVRLELVPLRQRTRDIPILIHHFVKKIACQYDLAKVPVFSSLALKVLKAYPWYGNVRELYNVIQKLVLEDVQGIIDLKHLPKQIIHNLHYHPNEHETTNTYKLKAQRGTRRKRQTVRKEFEESFNPRTLREVEKEYIERTLAYFNGNISMAAEALGLSRATLYRKIKQ